MSRMPRADIRRSEVTIDNVRNCRYLTADDYVVNYDRRTVNLDQLETVDFIVAPFKEAPSLAHTMLSFGFEDGQYVAISVEARLEKDETYSPVRGALKQFELIYIVGDERDLVQLRSNYRQSDVYIYPADVPRDKVRTLFVDMLQRANKLAESPEFYDTLTNNCTTNIVFHVNKIKPGLIPRDLRVILPGNSDHLAYELGLIDKTKSFDEVRRQARINDRAMQYASAPDFSQRIRR